MTEEDGDAIEVLLEKGERVLTAWEVDFLEKLQETETITPKQKPILDQIWYEVMVKGRRE